MRRETIHLPIVIDGEWRECTNTEKSFVRFALIKCVRHTDCDCARSDCIQSMYMRPVPRTRYVYDYNTFTIRDDRRIR